ncbi:MAG: site-specific integrase [Firmicutes bacterium]|nr:site-specific integrase [Bacillota bacterium]
MKRNSKDIMHVREYRNKQGELSYQLYCNAVNNGADKDIKATKVYVKTVKVPLDLKGKKELEAFRLECQLAWREEVDKQGRGIVVEKKEDIGFCEYASRWVENILVYNPEGYSHYNLCKGGLKVFEKHFGKHKLTEMTLPVVQKFCRWLCTRTMQKDKITVIRSLKPIITDKRLSVRIIAEGSGISHCTVVDALKLGATVNMKTAKGLCDCLQVPMDRYFKVESEKVPFSKASNRRLKIQLHSILKQAVIDGYITTNYAARDYTPTITGTEGEKEILDDMRDIQRFIKCVEQEPDIRKRVAFGMFINLGLRCAELAGLEWKDFDFENKQVSICRNTIYAQGFGTVTKAPKSKKSKRIISAPQSLMDLLAEYKAWWDEQKINHGDLWENTDRLFCQNNGKDMAGTTVAVWLREFEIKNDLPFVTPHGLRHTNITMLIANGVDVKTVSARVGHADIQTTLNIYTHYTSEADRQAANITEKLLRIGA